MEAMKNDDVLKTIQTLRKKLSADDALDALAAMFGDDGEPEADPEPEAKADPAPAMDADLKRRVAEGAFKRQAADTARREARFPNAGRLSSR